MANEVAFSVGERAAHSLSHRERDRVLWTAEDLTGAVQLAALRAMERRIEPKFPAECAFRLCRQGHVGKGKPEPDPAVAGTVLDYVDLCD